MYAGGGSHPLKAPCIDVLRLAVDRPGTLVTNAEVLQEMWHRYLAIRIWPQSRHILYEFENLLRGYIEPIHSDDVVIAAALADRYPGLQACDYLHLAVMQRLGIRHIVSADRGFDRITEVERLDPADFDAWQSAILDLTIPRENDVSRPPQALNQSFVHRHLTITTRLTDLLGNWLISKVNSTTASKPEH